tara:strand:- start:3603 stop:4481 length:879 start_codon:yes stop_codon:yes gene_type:complete
MNKELIRYINNKNIELSPNEKFVVIIGRSPSKGARSPNLWNSAYKKLDQKIKMYPLDVSQNNLKKLIDHLKKNKNFLGGSVTVPYKEKIFEILKNNSSKEAKKIGAINCIYRVKNLLKVTNTDGEGSVEGFKKNFKNAKIKKILVLGCGGAGKAVSTYFSSLKSTKELFILSRKSKDKNFSKKIKAKWLNRKKINFLDIDFDLIINCTTLGFEKNLSRTPLSRKYLSLYKNKPIIYDIIYNPAKTRLIKIAKSLNLKCLNGLNMNLYQAALAFNYVNRSNLKLDKIKKIMKG